MMRVLLVHNNYQHTGGEDSVFEAEASLLAKNGHEIETLRFSNQSIRSSLDALKTGLGSFYNPVSASLLQKKITAFYPDIIHVHNFFPLASPSILWTAKRAGLPVVMTLHNYRLLCPNALLCRDNAPCELCVGKVFALDSVIHGCYRDSRLQSAVLAAMTATHNLAGTWKNCVDRYIVMTGFARERFLSSSLQLAAEQVVIKPHFTFDTVAAGSREAVTEDYYLYAGRLSYEKGIKTLLEAFQRLEGRARLKIAGSGPMAADVQKAADECEWIEALGFTPRDEVQRLIRNARALIFPSLCYETFGLAIVEAFAAGTPVIVSDIGAPAELVQNDRNGICFRTGAAAALTAAIERMVEEVDLRARLAAAARTTYLEQYAPEGNYQRLIGIYQDAIEYARRRT